MISISPSTISLSRALLSSRRGSALFAFRQAVCKAQYRDAVPSCERDLVKGNAQPLVAGLVANLTAAAAGAAEGVAEGTTSAAGEAAPAVTAAAGGFGSGEAVLLLTPVFVYALFNVYRDRLNPQAKFLDYIYIMAAIAIFGNIFSILVFKTRFF